MELVALALGSNLGNREKQLEDSLVLIEERCGKILAVSSFHETKAEGFVSDDLFLNAALLMQTNLLPLELMEQVKQIEIELGRTVKTSASYESRLIDIDIILYGHHIVQTQILQIPHPKFRERLFVIEPLEEIAAGLEDPITGLSITELGNYLRTNTLLD